MKMNVLSLTLTFSIRKQKKSAHHYMHEAHMKHVRNEILDKLAQNLR
ncbi:hypothetical protein JOD43_003267 [Pullulanibacillus pueri]|uniref:YrzI family small protein n=1 Tax=Pullulanibacillus pueri TaxID=1437324 RepID=A0A8J3ENK8_9BACL|nr:YrzI family small protein [Pullulanibacillus pueri]MBM7683088.1 hypothetical protein [Pullulanibacillus pueri]GGH84844.1 hypothetical protein GCM10007096_28850 [Pullulanibacillus pueri]